MSEHTTACLEVMYAAANSPRNPMHGLPGAMAVSEDPPTITAAEFPAQAYLCPHGIRHYAYPTTERIEALRALNRGEAL